jgi:hypothetical protein
MLASVYWHHRHHYQLKFNSHNQKVFLASSHTGMLGTAQQASHPYLFTTIPNEHGRRNGRITQGRRYKDTHSAHGAYGAYGVHKGRVLHAFWDLENGAKVVL